jgi:RNA polymerase sigma factor (sigma-70 family)
MVTLTDINYSEAWELFVLEGSDKAFSIIYFSHYDLLYSVGLKYTSDTHVIEDSIQNIFTYLLKIRNKLKHVTNARSYLLKSFRNQLFLDLKKQKRLSFPDQLPEDSFEYFNSIEQSIFEQEDHSELHKMLKMSLHKLTKKQQEILYLRFDCELSYEEISNILEISIDSCYKSIYRSIKIIKSDIERMLSKKSC